MTERWTVQYKNMRSTVVGPQIRLQWAFRVKGPMPYIPRRPNQLPEYVLTQCGSDREGICSSLDWKELAGRLRGWNSDGLWDIVTGTVVVQKGA